jgi:hypothetical protein
MKAVNPWTGGDFNPFEVCDTQTDGAATTTTSIIQEVLFSSCNEVLCARTDETSEPKLLNYWSYQPNEKCRGLGISRPIYPNVPKRVTAYSQIEGLSEYLLPTVNHFCYYFFYFVIADS